MPCKQGMAVFLYAPLIFMQIKQSTAKHVRAGISWYKPMSKTQL